MSTSPHIPEDPSTIEWDVAVIGTGMGGAATGYGLAKLGRRVLFIEKGLFLHQESHVQEAESAKPDESLLAQAQLSDRADERPEARLTTSFLHVLRERNLVRTDREVRIVEQSRSLSGRGMEFNNETGHFTLRSEVRGRFEAKQP